MSEKHLQEVVAEIKYLIDQGQANDALPLTHLLLSHYPRYIQGYQLLAEIALEEGYTADAIEVFRRILSADPESFVAHAGLAVAYKEQKQAEDALWHIERAFEIEPALREVREELRQISELHTGRRPGRLRLNGVALSRIYMREGLYNQAVKQLKTELETQENRPDLLVALAESEWFAQRYDAAVQTSRQVQQELPLCLKINLILGQFYAQQENLALADDFLRVAQQLDPANELSAAWFGKTGYLQAKDVIIPLNGDANQNGNHAKMPNWLANLSLFAVDDPEAQQENKAITSIDHSLQFDLSDSGESAFVDANLTAQAEADPLISIDSDFDFDFSSEPAADLTGTLEAEPSSDWADQIGTKGDLIEPNIIEEASEPPAPAWPATPPFVDDLIEPNIIEEASEPPAPAVSPRPSAGDLLATPTASQPDWREALRAESWAALNQLSVLEAPSTEVQASLQSDWVARLRAETERALGQLQTETATTVVKEDQAPVIGIIHDQLSTADDQDESDQDDKGDESLATLSQIVAQEAEPAQEVVSSSKEVSPAPWQEALASATHAALASLDARPEEATEAIPEWEQQLAVATHAALAAYASQAHEASPSEAEPLVVERRQEEPTTPLADRTEADIAPVSAIVADTQASSAGIVEQASDISDQVTSSKEQDSTTTKADLGQIEAKQPIEPKAQEPKTQEPALESLVATPAKLDWRHGLMAATQAAFADADYEAPPSSEETAVDVVPTLTWRQQLASATHAALAEYEAAQDAQIAQEPPTSEEMAPSVDEPSLSATWKEGLKVATEAELASWTAPSVIEEEQKEVETPIDALATPTTTILDSAALALPTVIEQTEELKSTAKERRRLGKRWIEELRFETEVWLATVRRTHRKSEQTEPSSAPIVAPEEPTIIDPLLEITPSPVETAPAATQLLAQDSPVETEAAETAPAATQLLAQDSPVETEPVQTAPAATQLLAQDSPVETEAEPEPVQTAPAATQLLAQDSPVETEPAETAPAATQLLAQDSPVETEPAETAPAATQLLAQDSLVETEAAETAPAATQLLAQDSPVETEAAETAPAATQLLAQDSPVETEAAKTSLLPTPTEPQEGARPWVSALRSQTEQELAAKATWVAALRAETNTQLAQVAQQTRQEADLVSQSSDLTEEVSPFVQDVTQEAPSEVDLVSQSSDLTQEVSPFVQDVTQEQLSEVDLVSQSSDLTEEVSPFVQDVTQEAPSEVDLVSQSSDLTQEVSPFVQDVAQEAPSEVDLVSQSSDLTEQVSPFVQDVTQEAPSEVDLVSQSSDLAEEVSPFVQDVTQEAPSEVDLVSQSSDLTEQVSPFVQDVTQEQLSEVDLVGQSSQQPSQVDLVSQSSDLTEQVSPFVQDVTQEMPSSADIDVQKETLESSNGRLDVAQDVEAVSHTTDVTDMIDQPIPQTRPLSPSRTNGTAIYQPVVQDKWQVARQAWQVGKHKEAYAIYQTFFDESDEYDAQLDEALSAWTRIDDAPFLAFQLLGDVYRRMRRMQEAVKQYREAINRI